MTQLKRAYWVNTELYSTAQLKAHYKTYSPYQTIITGYWGASDAASWGAKTLVQPEGEPSGRISPSKHLGTVSVGLFHSERVLVTIIKLRRSTEIKTILLTLASRPRSAIRTRNFLCTNSGSRFRPRRTRQPS